MRFRQLHAAALALALAGAPCLAHADEPSPENVAMARQLGTQGQEAFDKKDFAEAEKLFAAASKLYPLAPTLTLGLARSQASLGKVVAAQENYNKIVREWGTATSAPPAFKAAADAAKTEVGAVSARIGSVVLQVEGATAAQVTLDGAPVPAVALGLRRPVDPGTHVARATADGMKPAESSFTVADGGHAEVRLKLEKEGAPVAAAPDPTPSPTEPAPADAPKGGGSTQKTLAFAAFGVGAAGLVVGGITGVLAMGKASDLDAACPDGRCPADRQGDIDSYSTLGTLSTVGFIVGGVGVAAGAALFFTAPKANAAQKASVTPVLGPGSLGFVGRF